ncbi:MAG: hypothetical protein PHY64_06505 [Eubacteriales bacterium]|nr:hypothetical protein [Eubacteriales bacterium]
MRKAKCCFALVLACCLGLCLCGATAEEPFPDALEIHLAAAGLAISVPGDMERLDADEEAYDLGFRYDCYTDTFEFTLYVQDSRDMSLADYAAFYAGRKKLVAKEDTINEFPVWRLTNAEDPSFMEVLVADPEADVPLAVYVLTFSCDGEEDRAMENAILNTLNRY